MSLALTIALTSLGVSCVSKYALNKYNEFLDKNTVKLGKVQIIGTSNVCDHIRLFSIFGRQLFMMNNKTKIMIKTSNDDTLYVDKIIGSDDHIINDAYVLSNVLYHSDIMLRDISRVNSRVSAVFVYSPMIIAFSIIAWNVIKYIKQ